MNILDQETILSLFHSNYFFFVIAVFLCAFGLTFYLIPKVLWVSTEKKLMAPVNERSAHKVAVPSFGGVAFFVTLVLLLSILQSLRLSYVGNHLIAGLTILFMVGLKDDLVISTARVKLFGQLAAVCFLVFSPELQLTNFHGFLGIYEIPEILGYFIKAVIAIALINAYNLIDGIDGLAAMTGALIASVYGVIFYLTGNSYFLLISVGTVGVLLAFLRFNFARGKRKIFMGDSGSLVIGLLLAFLTMKVLVMAPNAALFSEGIHPTHRVLLIISVLFLPAFDTLRVMIIRIINKKSPFSADRNHAHHILLDLGFSHCRASLSLAAYNILIIATYFFLATKLSTLWLSALVIFMYAATFVLFSRLKILSQKVSGPSGVKPVVEGIKVNRVREIDTRELKGAGAGN